MKMPNTLDRNKQLVRLRERYARRNKQGRTRMLDELCEQYGYDRKRSIKLLGDSLPQNAAPARLLHYEVGGGVLATIGEHG